MNTVMLMQEKGMRLRKLVRYAGASNKKLHTVKNHAPSELIHKCQTGSGDEYDVHLVRSRQMWFFH